MKGWKLLAVVLLLRPLTLVAGPEPETSAPDKAAVAAAADAAVRAVDAAWQAAFAKGDADALALLYHEDAIGMDPGPSMVLKGREAIRQSFVDMFETTSDIKVANTDVDVTVREDVAWMTGLWEVSAHDKGTDQTMVMKGRFSSIFERHDGKWLYVVDHASIPFVPPSAK